MKTLAVFLLGSLPAIAGVSYCQPIVIRHSMVPNSDQANYVLTVNDTDSHLATVANGGYVQNSNGNDIIFTSDSLGQDLLSWDPLEVYNPVTGQIVTEVQVGTVSHVTDTTIYRCAGSVAISSFSGGVTGSSWPAMYSGVWHLNETSGQQKDSTGNGNNSSTVAIAQQGSATGQIGGADGATGGNDYVQIPGASFSFPVGYTISGWVKSGGWGSGYRAVGRIDAAFNTAGLYVVNGHAVFYYSGNAVTGATTLQSGTWYYLALAANGPGLPATLYVNGAPDGTATPANSALGAISVIHLCGDGFSQPVDGTCDELRFADTAFSPDRIATDYNNQFSPATFYIPGAWTSMVTRTGGSQVFIF
jgi:hypothetical protein